MKNLHRLVLLFCLVLSATAADCNRPAGPRPTPPAMSGNSPFLPELQKVHALLLGPNAPHLFTRYGSSGGQTSGWVVVGGREYHLSVTQGQSGEQFKLQRYNGGERKVVVCSMATGEIMEAYVYHGASIVSNYSATGTRDPSAYASWSTGMTIWLNGILAEVGGSGQVQ